MKRTPLALLSLALLAAPAGIQAQAQGRLNPMIALYEQGLPVFGVAHVPFVAGGRGRGAAAGADGQTAPAPAQPDLAAAARELMAYKGADYEYNTWSSPNAARYADYMRAIIAAGGTARNHPFVAKIPIVKDDPEGARLRIYEQLNAGQMGLSMQRVESPEEVRQVVSAMRFKSKGGTRPDEGIELAAAYWGLTPAQYREKADVWPINPNGELVIRVIIESKEGLQNLRAIAAEPGVGGLTVGIGTLGGVFTTTNAAGERVRDQAAVDKAVLDILAACKEFKLPCGHPANNPAEMERLFGMGFNYFAMQSRNQAAFDAVVTGRKLSGRPLTP
jgi:2-keto-3-deoxy-L-rhamnonate aldolase RhmA